MYLSCVQPSVHAIKVTSFDDIFQEDVSFFTAMEGIQGVPRKVLFGIPNNMNSIFLDWDLFNHG